MTPDSVIVGQRACPRPNRARERAGLLLFLGLLLGSAVVRGAGHLPQLRGVMALGETWLAWFVVPDKRTQEWCRAGDRFGDFVVGSIDAQSATLLDAHGGRLVVSLPHPVVLNRHEPPTDPVAWQRWVNSRDNPMLLNPGEPPVDLARWSGLSLERRREITSWYRLHGWSLRVQIDAHGAPEIEFEPLQGDERQAIVAAKEHAFLKSLAPDQRVLHTTTQVVRSADAKERFRTALSPDQQEAFARLRDFTTPLPTPPRPSSQ